MRLKNKDTTFEFTINSIARKEAMTNSLSLEYATTSNSNFNIFTGINEVFLVTINAVTKYPPLMYSVTFSFP